MSVGSSGAELTSSVNTSPRLGKLGMRTLFAFLLVAIALSGAATTASGQANRIWVSGHGVDGAGCGGAATPCRTLQYAHDNLVAGGEIDVLDPAGYGSIVITKSISIVNEGVGVAGVLQSISGADAIAVQAQANDIITLVAVSYRAADVGPGRSPRTSSAIL